MSTPFQFQGTLLLPGTSGALPEPLPFGISDAFDSKASFEYNLPAGSGTKIIDFGTAPAAGVKAFLLIYDFLEDAPPVLLKWNGGTDTLPIPTGGFLAMGMPAPVAGVTAVSIVYTGEGKVRVWLLG